MQKTTLKTYKDRKIRTYMAKRKKKEQWTNILTGKKATKGEIKRIKEMQAWMEAAKHEKEKYIWF